MFFFLIYPVYLANLEVVRLTSNILHNSEFDEINLGKARWLFLS